MKKPTFKIASALVLSGALFFNSCKKNEQVIDDPVINNPSGGISKGATITSSVGGVVVDESNNPVIGAQVYLGSNVTLTDSYGAFLFKNISVGDRRDYVKVSKSGYFHGSRAFDPNVNTVTQVKIKLLSNASVGNFNSATGGTISSNGVSLNFPSNAIIVEGGGAYTGTVNVALKFLDPSSSSIGEIMPGDLLALNENNEERMLETFGMAAVELKSPTGQKLNVASGKTVELKIPLSGAYLMEAPASIPLWYFDEVHGNWVEEGSATLIGSEYVGEVSHFSFWNCDQPNPGTSIQGKIVCSNIGVAGVSVTIKNPTGRILGIVNTDNMGSFSGFIPQNTLLTIEVMDICGSILYTGNIGPFGNAPVTLPDISACSASSSGVLTATLLDCSNNPITNGSALIEYGSTRLVLFPDASGNVSSIITYCSASTLDITAFDFTNGKQSTTQTVSTGATITIGNISVCNNVDQYLNYSIDGNSVSVLEGAPSNYLYVYDSSLAVVITDLGGSNNNNYVSFSIASAAVGTFTPNFVYAGISGLTSSYSSSNANAAGMSVTFTVFGTTTGSYVEGSFTGSFIDDITLASHTLTGNFRIKR